MNLDAAQNPTTKQVVITVHGIRTHAKWQKSVTPILGEAGRIVIPHDYGNFGLWKFLRKKSRDAEIERFRALYEQIVTNRNYGLDPDDHVKRPSVVAHSFGTYIVAHCLRKHDYVRLDKILLCGCILRQDFDWSELFARDQANHVLNLCCMKDPWVPRAGKLVHDAGDSGVQGFWYWGSLVETEKREDCSHSDFFTEGDVRGRWVKFLSRAPAQYKILHSRNVSTQEELIQTLNNMHELDVRVFRDCPHFEDADLPRGISTKWIEINNDIYTFLVERANARSVGYINAMPVSDECFKSILAGTKADKEITADDLRSYEPNAAISLYLMSIAVDPDHQKHGGGLDSEALEHLINGMIGKLMYYAMNRNLRVKQIAAVGWTAIGRKLCERLGMKKVSDDKYENPVFLINLEDSERSIPLRHPGLRRLLSVYDSMRSASR